MIATIDRAGRLVIPAEIRRRLGLQTGTRLEVVVDGFSLRLVRAVPGPELARRGERWVARPRIAESEATAVDIAQLIDEERDRWPR